MVETATIIAVALFFIIVCPTILLIWRFRSEYRSQLADLQEKLQGPEGKKRLPLRRMIRVKGAKGVLDGSSPLIKSAGVLDLRDEYKTREGGGGVVPAGAPKVGLSSISEYLASLRPDMDPDFKGSVVEEVNAVLAQAIVSAVGPRTAQLLLPLMGWANVAGRLVKVAGGVGVGKDQGDEATLASVTSEMVAKVWEATSDISLMGLGAGADTVATVVRLRHAARKLEEAAEETKAKEGGDNKTPLLVDKSVEEGRGGKGGDVEMQKKDEDPPIAPGMQNKNPSTSPVSIMRHGEARSPTFTEDVFPSPFVMESDFEKALSTIMGADRVLEEKAGVKFDPDAFPIDRPVPMNPVMLPGLHRGFGGVLKTQTYREVLCARTLNVLLNKLGSNATREPSEMKFIVSLAGKEVTRPEDLIKGLMETGHNIVAKVRFNTVSFGFGLCIKEEDGTWTNIPWAMLFRTGHEDRNHRPTHTFFNHGGVNLIISGPLVKKCATQHHSSVDGFVGWYTNETCNVPWLTQKMEMGNEMRGEDVVKAVRYCALYATALNQCATKMELPIAGYALMGVCIDSTAVVEHALTGQINSFPCLHLGRFHGHAIREARVLLKTLKERDDPRVEDMKRVVRGMLSLPTDIGAVPSGAADAARRLILSTPKAKPFKIMERTIDACNEIIAEAEGR